MNKNLRIQIKPSAAVSDESGVCNGMNAVIYIHDKLRTIVFNIPKRRVKFNTLKGNKGRVYKTVSPIAGNTYTIVRFDCKKHIRVPIAARINKLILPASLDTLKLLKYFLLISQ